MQKLSETYSKYQERSNEIIMFRHMIGRVLNPKYSRKKGKMST
jgi:hypothetical protein